AKSGALPLGYYKDPEGTAKTFPVIDGIRYSIPGDWCKVNTDGTMILLGRGNNCINSGGEKIFPEEVEEALKRVPGILDAAVFGIPDDRWGNAVAALIQTSAGQSLEATYIESQLQSHLARYKQPKSYRFTTESFRHANGKLNYRGAQRIWDHTD
ncbi:MAG: hypothetical protein KDI36_17950, partial [Pseudomonadales bacterium]|nr:hypothetical protein [Pseudomonadales bacterium]